MSKLIKNFLFSGVSLVIVIDSDPPSSYVVLWFGQKVKANIALLKFMTCNFTFFIKTLSTQTTFKYDNYLSEVCYYYYDELSTLFTCNSCKMKVMSIHPQI